MFPTGTQRVNRVTYALVFVSAHDQTQDVHSDHRKQRLKRPKKTLNRCITALNFTVFHPNPSSRFMGRFLIRKRSSFLTVFFIVIWVDGLRRRIHDVLHRITAF